MAGRYWYGYIMGWDIFDPASYVLLPNQNVTCITGSTICAIYAHKGDVFPLISDRLTQYITNSTTANVPQPAVAGEKKFLYKRS